MSKIISMLENIPIFESFSPEELGRIASLFVEHKYKKGTILFFEGDPGEDFYLVKNGVVKIYRLDDTKEIILALFRDGDFFGEMSLIQKGLTRSATAETLEACSIYTLSRSEFFQFLESSPRLCLKLLEITADRLRKANEQIFDLTFLGVRSRIFKTIIRLSEEYGEPSQQGSFINMKLTHQELANLVGTVRESVTKVLQELQEENIILIQKKKIILKNMDALQRKLQH